MTLPSIMHQAVKLTKDNSPLILTALGVAGTVTTAVLTGKAAIKADKIVNRNRRQFPDMSFMDATPKQYVLETWKLYIPPMLAGVGTIACIICANRIGTRRAAALATAYSLSVKGYEEYKDKVVDQFGKVKEQKVRDQIAQDRMITDKIGSQEIFDTGGGSELCYEKFTGRYFYSSMASIKDAVNQLNHKVNTHYEASLNDFYDYLGLDNNTIGDELGWNSDKLLEVSFTTTIAIGDRACLVFDYTAEPRRGYFRYA